MDFNIVYWSHPFAEAHLNFQNILNNVKQYNVNKNVDNYMSINFIRCPFFNTFARKTFNILSPFDYSLIMENGSLKSYHYDKQFFDNVVFVRDEKYKLFGLKIMGFLFFTEENCTLTFNRSYFSNSDFSYNTDVIPGQFNISRWFRPVDLAFIIKKQNQLINIKKGDPLFSINFEFNNNKKIIFKRYNYTGLIHHYSNYKNTLSSSDNDRPKFDQLTDYFYDMFDNSGIKNPILKEIKSNLVE